MTTPREIAARVRSHPAIQGKLSIGRAREALGLRADGPGRPGDDAAILPRAGGVDLLAGEGFIPAFVREDPWFAGWCGVMVNLSDIAAMGGQAVGMIDQVWASSPEEARPLMAGLRAASEAYGVPLVGGHTNFDAPDLGLAVSVFGRAQKVITSFDARPGDTLVMACDLRGDYYNFDNYCAALLAPPERLRGDLAVLPGLANAGLVRAGKDISQGGIAGTSLMLAECSGVGIDLDLERLCLPDRVGMDRWLRSFPSFGFLLSVPPVNVTEVCAAFEARAIWAAPVGEVREGHEVRFRAGGETALFWDHDHAPYLGLSQPELNDA